MTDHKEHPPCSECNGGCCISYDVIALEPDEVKHFGVPRISIGVDGCQYLEKGRCSIHNERLFTLLRTYFELEKEIVTTR